jgi:hypothetical protein
MKTKQEKLKAFIRSNKKARERKAIIEGFKTADEFRAYLEGNGKEKKKTTKRKATKKKGGSISNDVVIHNVHILDRSGSMGSSKYGKLSVAIAGINEEITELRKADDAVYYQTIVEFDNRIKTVHNKVPIKSLQNFSTTSGGMTALNQAIGETLEKLISNHVVGEKTIVKVFTDGGENMSRGKYASAHVIKELIRDAMRYDITVAFVGTAREVLYATNNLGVSASNTLTHDNTIDTIRASFQTTNVSTKSYVSKAKKGEATLDGFYKEVGTLD